MEIPLPLAGLNEALAFSDQPRFTARVAGNARGRDPVTGRVRLSKRAGMTRYVPSQLTTSKIARIIAAVYDSRRTTYAVQEPERVTSVDLDGSRIATTGVADRQDNVLVIDGGHSIARYNSDLRLTYTIKCPVPDDKHVVGAVVTDSFGNIYAAVSSGGNPDTAKVWRFRQKKDREQPDLVWTYTPGGYVTRMRVRGDVLYLAVEIPESETGKIVQLQGALSSGPVVGWQKVVSYPLPAFDIKTNGDVVFTSPANTKRGIDPRYPNFTEKTVDAAIRDVLPQSQKRVWSDGDAAQITGLVNGDAVALWEDASGNGRDWFQGPGTSDTAPVYQPDAINGRPALFFRGVSTALGTQDYLQSSINPSGDSASSEQQRTPTPAYQGARWAKFFVIRPSLEPVGVTPIRRCVWSMRVVADGSGLDVPETFDMQLWVNRTCDGASAGSPLLTTATRGAITFISKPSSTYPGAGLGTGAGVRYSREGYFNNDCGTVLVTLTYDNGQNQGTDDATVSHCTLRVNGHPIDRWVGTRTVAEGPELLGASHDTSATTTSYYKGHIARILTIRDSDEAANGLLTMPLYPRTVGTLPGTAVAWDSTSDTELEKIEGVLMHEYGIAHLAPDYPPLGSYTAPVLTSAALYTSGNYPHPYSRRRGPPRADTDLTRSEEYRLASPTPILGKLDGSKGSLQWVVTSAGYAPADGGSEQGFGGLGGDVAVSGDRIFSIGSTISAGGTFPDGGYGGDNFHIRCLVDKNQKGRDGYSRLPSDGLGAWVDKLYPLGTTADNNATTWDSRCKIDVDPFANLYLPGAFTGSTVSARVYQGVRTDGIANVIAEIPLFAPTYAAIVQKLVPAYRIGLTASDDFSTAPTSNSMQARAEYFYLLGETASGEPNEVYQYRLVDVVTTSGSPRTITPIAWSGGSMFRFTSAGATAPAGTGTLTNPVYVGNYVNAVQAFGKVYFTDGRRYYTYDPRLDIVSYWRGDAGGKIPPRCRLIELWNGRIVLARAPDDPHGWHMSAQSLPLDWDFFPVPATATMAVSAVSARAGAAPDMINALIPYSDDLLIFGCESSIWIMRGDPAVAGSQFDQVSNDVGVSFGRAWCRDPEGRVYFFSSKGGVYRMAGGGAPESLTRGPIDRQMRDIDLSVNYVELAWNEEADGLHVLVYPYGAGGAAVTNWFLQRDPDGWFVDTTTSTDVQPTAHYQLDGDMAADRGLIFGTQTGTICKYDKDATSDDTEPIASQVIWGPFAPKSTRMTWRFAHPTFVLDLDQGGCDLSLYVGVEPSVLTAPTWTDTLIAGRNAALPMRGKGEYVWLEVSDRSGVTRWSIEAASIDAVPAGRSRDRV